MTEKTRELEQAARQCGNTILFLATPTKIVVIPPPDQKAAERAKRYIWSRTTQATPDDPWATMRAQ